MLYFLFQQNSFCLITYSCSDQHCETNAATTENIASRDRNNIRRRRFRSRTLTLTSRLRKQKAQNKRPSVLIRERVSTAAFVPRDAILYYQLTAAIASRFYELVVRLLQRHVSVSERVDRSGKCKLKVHTHVYCTPQSVRHRHEAEIGQNLYIFLSIFDNNNDDKYEFFSFFSQSELIFTYVKSHRYV